MSISGLPDWRRVVVDLLCRAMPAQIKLVFVWDYDIWRNDFATTKIQIPKAIPRERPNFLWHVRKLVWNNNFNTEAFLCSRSFDWTIGGTTSILNGPKNSIHRSGKRPKKTTDKLVRATFPTFEENWWRTAKHHPAMLEPPNSAPWRRRRCWSLLPLS